jgi:hypothetical protein
MGSFLNPRALPAGESQTQLSSRERLRDCGLRGSGCGVDGGAKRAVQEGQMFHAFDAAELLFALQHDRDTLPPLFDH